jgi:hypothetical protein
MDITQGQWEILEKLFPKPITGKVGRPVQDVRAVLNDIFMDL